MRWTLWLAAILLSITYLMGLWLYPEYRTLIKPRLIAENIAMAYLFESKEHLAFFSFVAVNCGAAISLLSTSKSQHLMGWVLLLSGWVCGAITAIFGILVAAA